MDNVDCSLRAYANEFSQELNQCLKKNSALLPHTGEAACVTYAALEAITKMRDKCSAHSGSSPDCTPGGYVDAVLEEFDPESKALKIGFGKVVKALDKKLGGILPPPEEVVYVTLAGCAVGGVLGGIGGAATTPALPILGGGFGLVKGCEHGVKVGMGLYGLWKISVKVGGVYEATGIAYDALANHSRACAAKPLSQDFPQQEIPLPATPSIPSSSKSYTTFKLPTVATTTPPIPTPTYVNIPPSFPIPKIPLLQPSMDTPVHDVPLTPAPSIVAAAPAFEWIDIKETAEKIVDIAQDITGVTSVAHQAKELKALFVSILSSPENGPKLLVGQLLKEPEKILQRIVDAPEEFLTKSDIFLSDPTLGGAVNVIGAAYSIISLANDILPIATKIRKEAFKNPIALPATITKELVKLTTNKIVGVVKLAEGLLKDPIKTSTSLVKGIIKSPETLLKNVKCFLGLHKDKAKKRAEKLKRLQAQAERQIQASNERTIQEIIEVLPGCYSLARKQWMILETLSPEEYLSAIVKDWKMANANRTFNGSCGPFLRMIHFFLANGLFDHVAAFSPTAHTSTPIPPMLYKETLLKYSQANWSLACEARVYQRNAHEFSAAVSQLTATIATTGQEAQLLVSQTAIIASGPSLVETSAKIQTHIAAIPQEAQALQQKGEAIAARLRGKTTPEEVAKLRAKLNKT